MILKNVEKKENSTAAFTVEVDAAEFEAAVNAAYLKSKKDIHIQGFRKGKAPRKVVEGMYGADVFHQGAFEELAPEAFAFGVKEGELEVVGTPDVDKMDISEDKVATFTFVVGVYPEVTLGQYKGLSAEKTVLPVTDEEIAKEFETIQRRNSRSVSVEGRATQEGDHANIDFEGRVDGEVFEGGSFEGYSIEIGSGTFIPGFEEQLIGLNIGEEKDVNVTFPQNYAEHLAGKDAVFHVKLNSISVRELPALDDEFAKDNGFDTMAEYDADMRANLEKRHEAEAENGYRDQLLKQAVENMTVTVPECMYEERVEDMIRGYAANYCGPEANSLDLNTLCSALGFTQETIDHSIRPNAEKQVKADLLVDAIIEAENFEVSEEELDEFVKRVASGANVNPEEIRAQYSEDVILNERKKERAMELILETAAKAE